ncbi:MAG: HD domain-containing protein [Cyanobacteria bacterium P01_G01_bin.54]
MSISCWSPDVFKRAWDFATQAHARQTYGSPIPGQRIPYLNHVGNVAMEVIWALTLTPIDFNGDLAIQCALLHDVIEDTPHTYAELAVQFGPAVADGVQALTKDETLPTKAAQMQDSLRRILQQPREVWLVKLGDRITNLAEPPHYWQREKRQAYRSEAEQIHAALYRAHGPLAERLWQKIQDYGQFIDR